MASARLTCPDCRSVLKPAKPVPDGKKVKCPKCGNLFTSPGLVEDEEEEQLPRKKASAKKQTAAIKKAPDPKPAAPRAAEDEEGGTYSFIDDDAGGVKEEEEEDEKPKIDYAPDMSIKDLRGPAQAAVVRPSNYMILIGGLTCLCDILIICVMFWPMVFSEHLIDHEKFLDDYYKRQSTPEAKARLKSIPADRKDLRPEELAAINEATAAEAIARFIILGIYIVLFIYNGLTVFGAVKMQNLESRGWGIAASIMTILPFSVSGLSAVIGFLFFLLFAMLLDDAAMGMMYSGGVSLLVWVLGIFVGVWSIRTLMSEEVVAGFEYTPD